MGALLGIVVAGALSAYSTYANSEAAADAKKDAETAASELKAAYADLISDVEDHYAKTDDEVAQGEADVANYESKLRDMDQEQYVKDYYAQNGLDEGFSYDKEVSDFLDPRADYLKSLAGRAAQASAAGSGMGRSYDGAMAIGTAVANKNEALYSNALSEYNTDRNQAYTEWNSYLQQKQNELSNLLTGQNNDLSAAKSLADLYKEDQDSEWQDLMNARIAALNAGYSADSAAASTGNSTTDLGGIAQVISAGANVGDKVGSYFSGGKSSSAV